MRVPAVLAAVPLLIGAVAGLLVGDGDAVALARIAAAATILALLAAGASLATGSGAEGGGALALGYALAGVSLGSSAAHRAYRPPLLQWFETRAAEQATTPTTLEGLLREDASQVGSGLSLTIDVAKARLPGGVPSGGRIVSRGPGGQPQQGGVRLSIAGSPGSFRIGEWRAGRQVRLTAMLRKPAVYLDPGVRDEQRALARRGIVLVGTVKSAALVDVTARGSPVTEGAAAARIWTRSRLADAVGRWSPKSAAIATAVLIGDRTGLPDADTRRLQDAGTYHVIAISGGNIAILTAILLGIFRMFGVPARPASWITMCLLLGYGQIVVPSSSVQRAITAAAVYLTARGLDQQGPALNVLAVAGAIGIAASPVVIVDPGFLLSFGATLGILALVGGAAARAGDPREPGADPPGVAHPAGSGASHRGGALLRRGCSVAWELLRTTIAAEAALLPIAAVMFGRVTFAGLVLNFAAIPLMSVLQTLSMLALAVSTLSVRAAAICGYGAHLAAAGIVASARLTERAPWLARDVALPAVWVLMAYYAALSLTVLARSTRVRRIAAALALGIVGLIVAGPWWCVQGLAPPEAGVRIAFLDVGQGDATAILLPDGHAVLVDAGGVASAQPIEATEGESGGFDIGARIVAPALRALGVRTLDVLTVTHGDPDHIGGAPAILRAFRPAVVWEGVPVPPHPWLRGLRESADALRLHWRTVQAGDAERVGPLSIRVLHPALPDWERQRVRNEDSVVLDVRIGAVSIILPGDIGAEGERAILQRVDPARIVVLKAPHHGSNTSSTPALLSRLHPAVVVFSAGRKNRFGHPAPRVVARYREAGAAMFSTAEDGAVLLDTDGHDVLVRGLTGRGLLMRARE